LSTSQVSHELTSDVVLTALHPLVEGGVIPPERWLHRSPDAQRRAVVWLASYCPSHIRRAELVRRLVAALPPSMPMHSVGNCLHNHDEPALLRKGGWAEANASIWESKARVPRGRLHTLPCTSPAPHLHLTCTRPQVRVLSGYAVCLIAENSVAAEPLVHSALNVA
jgi:hypothetical protein